MTVSQKRVEVSRGIFFVSNAERYAGTERMHGVECSNILFKLHYPHINILVAKPFTIRINQVAYCYCYPFQVFESANGKGYWIGSFARSYSASTSRS